MWFDMVVAVCCSNSGECELDWGANMAWGWPFLLRLAEARRRRLRQATPHNGTSSKCPPATGDAQPKRHVGSWVSSAVRIQTSFVVHASMVEAKHAHLLRMTTVGGLHVSH